MDTLVIVRKIREAEALADKGSHGDAMRMLQPLLGDEALQDAQRTLIRKKLELFEKQRQRVTRILTRSASSSSSLSAVTGVRKAVNPNETSELTAIRKPIEDATERPTDLTIEKPPQGVPTEAVPRVKSSPTISTRGSSLLRRAESPPDHITDIGRPSALTPIPHSSETTVRIPPPARPAQAAAPGAQASATSAASADDSTLQIPALPAPRPDPNDSQELAPLTEDSMGEEGSDDDPRTTSIFAAPAPVVVDQVVSLHAPSAPALTRPAFDNEQKTPPPSPRKAVPESAIANPLPVRDSIVVPRVQNVIPTPAPGPPGMRRDDDDSTYLLADEHFASRPSARKTPQSTPDLKALVDRLPDDDLRRELAMEVVRLREELEKSRRGMALGDSPSRRAERVQPESGTFHIPASQANTIVRRAAGSDRIEVHMPSRDEDAAELQVLRRDSVRGRKAGDAATDRVSTAQDYLETGPRKRGSILKPVAAWLALIATIALIGWLLHLGWRSLNSAEEISGTRVTETTVGGLDLSSPLEGNTLLDGASKDIRDGQLLLKARPWVVQYGQVAGQDVIVAITVPLQAEKPGVHGVLFNARSLSFDSDLRVKAVMEALGEPTPAFSEEQFKAQAQYTLAFVDRQGRSVLEFRYNTRSPDKPVAVRLVDARVMPPFPDLPGTP